MSKQPRNLLKEIIADLDHLAGDRTAHERLAYQVGFLAVTLAQIYEKDWILRRDWNDRIDALKSKRNLD